MKNKNYWDPYKNSINVKTLLTEFSEYNNSFEDNAKKWSKNKDLQYKKSKTFFIIGAGTSLCVTAVYYLFFTTGKNSEDLFIENLILYFIVVSTLFSLFLINKIKNIITEPKRINYKPEITQNNYSITAHYTKNYRHKQIKKRYPQIIRKGDGTSFITKEIWGNLFNQDFYLIEQYYHYKESSINQSTLIFKTKYSTKETLEIKPENNHMESLQFNNSFDIYGSQSIELTKLKKSRST